MVMPGVFHMEILNTEFMCRNAYIGRKDGHYSDTHIGICRDSNIPLDHGSGSATFCRKFPAHAVCQFLTVTGSTAYNKSITVCIVSGKDTTVTGIFSGQGIHSVT